jgi:hypothetical protein
MTHAYYFLSYATIDNLVRYIVEIPGHAQGKFRLSENELQELWDYTLQKTQECGERIERDLADIADDSQFSEALQDEVKNISRAFWHETISTPSSTAMTLTMKASSVLSKLLGGDTMFEPIEDLDANLVIEPIFSEEDAHLIFWKTSV